MSRNTVNQLLVCYDISDERRLQRVHRRMKRWGMPVQYSVFYCKLTPRDRRRMENELRSLIDDHKDDIRVYGIKSLSAIEFMGQRAMSSDLPLYGAADTAADLMC